MLLVQNTMESLMETEVIAQVLFRIQMVIFTLENGANSYDGKGILERLMGHYMWEVLKKINSLERNTS